MEKGKHIKLRTVFMGTSDFAKNILEALVNAQYNIVGVYTKPDSAINRKKELIGGPVKEFASASGIQVYQPEKFTDEAVDELKKLKPDLVIVAAYGKILPKKVLEIPGFGCINIHPSLLPKFRGPSPIQNALLLGEKETGTSIMVMDEGMDTGDIIAQKRIDIDNDDNYISLSKKLSDLSIALLLGMIEPWIDRRIEPQKQDDMEATLCQLIEREDGRVIWEQDAQEIYNRFRAFYPWPGIFSFWKNGESVLRIMLLEIRLQKSDTELKHDVGEVFELGESVGIQTINGVIIVEKIQIEGKEPVSIESFINGYPGFLGSRLF